MSCKIIIHTEPDIRADNYSHRWLRYLESNHEDISVHRLNLKDREDLRSIDSTFDGVMWHYYHHPRDKQIAPNTLTILEENYGLKSFPDHSTRWHFDDKTAQSLLLNTSGFPSVPMWLFNDSKKALEFVNNYQTYPLVAKLKSGASAENVVLLKNSQEARNYVMELFTTGVFPNRGPVRFGQKIYEMLNPTKIVFDYKTQWQSELQRGYAYFQEFIPNNSFDIRVTVIGKRAFGFTRNNRPNDFRASGSGSIDYDLTKVPLESVKTAFAVSRKYGFQSMAYDFLKSRSGDYIISEISYGYLNTAIRDTPGYWDEDLNFVEGNYWPEHLHVEDFLEYLGG